MLEILQVMKMAEKTATAMSVFPFHTVLKVLVPIIQTDPYPSMQGAIKMLTKLVEVHPEEVTDEDLRNIMPGLVKVKQI